VQQRDPCIYFSFIPASPIAAIHVPHPTEQFFRELLIQSGFAKGTALAMP
jgi:hypothetical protein